MHMQQLRHFSLFSLFFISLSSPETDIMPGKSIEISIRSTEICTNLSEDLHDRKIKKTSFQARAI